LEYNLLNSYLENGGRLYLEGMVGWNPDDDFWGKFGTHAPLDMLARIDAIGYDSPTQNYVWQYDQTDTYTDVLVPYTTSALPLFHTVNVDYPQANIAIWNSNGSIAPSRHHLFWETSCRDFRSARDDASDLRHLDVGEIPVVPMTIPSRPSLERSAFMAESL
jgi:hypothetical protein